MRLEAASHMIERLSLLLECGVMEAEQSPRL